MKLTIVIPAFNEEEAIGSAIERCLAAREGIIAASPVTAVEIIVVSDGSTDATASVAREHEGVSVIVFERNRGYGAAIKAGFAAGTGELVGFLDADGTCDPVFFGPLCDALFDKNAAVALGSRMGQGSRMPLIRRIGNTIYALILSVLSNRVVTDSASGMRVIRRDALGALYPLPDGLHFTPAMSARVLMDDRLAIVELPMSYEERIGESKLHVLRDGVRFLRTILEMTLMWRPAKLFVVAAIGLVLTTAALGLHPIETWLRTGALREDSIYRLLSCCLLAALGMLFLSTGVVAENVHRLVDDRLPVRTFAWTMINRAYSLNGVVVAGLLTLPATALLIGPGVWTRLTDGYVDLHWSRVVLAGLIGFCAVQMLVAVLMANILRFHAARRHRSSAEQITASATVHRRSASVTQPDPTAPATLIAVD